VTSSWFFIPQKLWNVASCWLYTADGEASSRS